MLARGRWGAVPIGFGCSTTSRATTRLCTRISPILRGVREATRARRRILVLVLGPGQRVGRGDVTTGYFRSSNRSPAR